MHQKHFKGESKLYHTTPTQEEGGLIFKEREGVGWNDKLGISFAMLRIA